MNLSDSDKRHLEDMIGRVKDLSEMVREPVDPKVEACLELAFRLLAEQIYCDRAYAWSQDSAPAPDDKFLHLSDDDDIPDADELNSWLGGE